MSQTIISVFILLLSQILPKLGVTIGNDDLTTTVTTILTVGAAIWIWVRRVKAGDVHVLGSRK